MAHPSSSSQSRLAADTPAKKPRKERKWGVAERIETFVTFTFRYTSQSILQARGIIAMPPKTRAINPPRQGAPKTTKATTSQDTVARPATGIATLQEENRLLKEQIAELELREENQRLKDRLQQLKSQQSSSSSQPTAATVKRELGDSSGSENMAPAKRRRLSSGRLGKVLDLTLD